MKTQSIRLVFVQLIDILSDLHSRNIFHRDLKRANILVDPNTGEVNLVDFGLSLQFDKDAKHEDMIQKGAAGTPNYQPPEMLKKKRQYQSDIYLFIINIIIILLIFLL